MIQRVMSSVRYKQVQTDGGLSLGRDRRRHVLKISSPLSPGLEYSHPDSPHVRPSTDSFPRAVDIRLPARLPISRSALPHACLTTKPHINNNRNLQADVSLVHQKFSDSKIRTGESQTHTVNGWGERLG